MFPFHLQTQQKMTRKIEASDVPSLPARAVDDENSQCHRQTFAPIDHPHQIRVLQVVVVLAVAAVAVMAIDYVPKRRNALAEMLHPARRNANVVRDDLDM